MPYVPISPAVMDRYLRGDSIYMGPTASVNYRVASTVVDPVTGEIKLTGMREQQGEFPVLPGMFFSWVTMGIINFLVGKLFSLFGFKTNPLELRFHYGVLEHRDYAPLNGIDGGSGYPTRRNGNGYSKWEDGLAKQLYPLD